MTGEAQAVVGATRLSALHILKTPFSLYAPVATLLVAGAALTGATPRAILAGMLGGLAAWTFFEYWLHRLVLHMLPRGGVRRYVAGRHILHHRNPAQSSGVVLLWVSVLVAVPTLGILILTLGALGTAVMSGIVIGYLLYEYAHLASHLGLPPATPWGARLRRHHLGHHNDSPRHNFAITLPLWDYVFATKARSEPSQQRSGQ